jgi:eukaryotic-like serine/threonine-protein kinase
VRRVPFDGRYEILRRLGVGGMAEVYLGRDEHLRRYVALKVLKERLSEDEDFLKRFRREARSAATLNHPNVVQIYDQRLSEDGRHFIAMEYVPGGTLKERLSREGALEPAGAARLASQIAVALRVAHEAGVVHRDVKSRNVLLTAAGDVKVADFGIALAADATTISGPGFVIGTAGYMSPEQVTGMVATPSSDLYSLGVVLYEMLTGVLPFKADDPAEVRAKHASESPPHPRDANPGIPEEMDDLVIRLMDKDPERRLGSANELVDELRRMREPSRAGPLRGAASGPPTVQPSAPNPPPSVHHAQSLKPPRRRGFRLLAVLAALLVLLVVAGSGLVTQATWGSVTGTSGNPVDVVRGALEGARRAVLGPRKVAVPDVEGLTEREARARLSEGGLGARIRPRESSEGDAGRVLEQSVPGGRKVEEGSEVLLAVGKGPPRSPGTAGEGVPNLAGLSYPEAEAALQASGFVLGGVKEVPSRTVPEGVIVGQDPRAGSAAPRGSAVYLTTSTGRAGSAASSAPASASPTAPASAAP